MPSGEVFRLGAYEIKINETLYLLKRIRKLVFSKMVHIIDDSIHIIESLNEENKQLRSELAALKEGEKH